MPATTPLPPRQRLALELTWWAFALVLAALVLLPVYRTVPEFPFFGANFLYVVVAVTLTRYLFFLDISWLRDRLFLQGGLIFVLIPLIFYMVQQFNGFITFFDEEGPDVLTRHLDAGTGRVINGYLKSEYRFFGVWAVVAALIMPFRLLRNIWLRYRAGVRT